MFTYRTYSVSHGKDGFRLRLEEHSRFRDAVAGAYESFTTSTGHLLCCRTALGSRVLNAVLNWAWHKETQLAEIEIDRAMADKLAFYPDSWTHLDNEDEDEVD